MKKFMYRGGALLLVVLLLLAVPSVAFAAETAEGQEVYAEVVPAANVVHTDAFPGAGGAPWTLYDDGTVVVGDGHIQWNQHPALWITSPWQNTNGDLITTIQFRGSNTFGPSLHALFLGLSNLISIEGLEDWDVSNVTDMSSMFSSVSSLTELDVSRWDVSNVTITTNMFSNTSSLTTLDVSGWDVSNVTHMPGMFGGASSLTKLDVSEWNTSSVISTAGMFRETSSLTELDVSRWDVSNVTAMSGMFSGASSLTELDLSGWDVSNVTTMQSMFFGASSLTELDISNWNVSNVRIMERMFQEMSSLRTLDLSGWNFWITPTMVYMFRDTPLRELTLGENLSLASLAFIELPDPLSSARYTGYWVNVGAGTVDHPLGEHVLTSAQLIWHHQAVDRRLETWVWQRNPQDVDFEAGANGSIDPVDPTSLTVLHGDTIMAEQTIPTPMADTGFVFSHWTSSDSAHPATIADAAALRALPITEDVTFTAVFVRATGGNGNGNGTVIEDPSRQAFLIGSSAGEGQQRLIHPRGNITRAEVATIFFRLIEDEVRAEHWMQTNPFTDVEPQRWFNNAISTTAYMGLFEGVSEDRFAPNQNITRGELAAVLVRFMHSEQADALTAGDDEFSDLAGHWASAYINEAARQGWIEGYPDGTFRPRQPITRAETAAMINRIFQRLIETPDCRLDDMITWPDNTNENSWYFLYMYMATNSYTYRWRSDSDRYKALIEIIEPRDWSVLERPHSRPEDIHQSRV